MKSRLIIAFLLISGVALGQRPKFEHNFGDVAHKTTSNTTFFIKAMDCPMWIREVKSSCSCVKVKHSKKVVMAGDSVALNINFSADDKGVFFKTLKVFSSDERVNSDVIIRGRVK